MTSAVSTASTLTPPAGGTDGTPGASAQHQGTRFRAGVVIRLAAPAVLTAIGLLIPCLALLVSGISLVGGAEESTGYRYFYSLRLLYTPDERPWLPQGHPMTIIHIGVQALLTAVGYSPWQILPRMNIFAYVGAVLPHLATAAALTWAVLPLRHLAGRLLVAAVLVAANTDASLGLGYHLLLPDYYSWIPSLAMLVLGCCLRITGAGWRPSWAWVAGLGALAGLLVAFKITLVALAAPPLCLLLARWPRRRTVPLVLLLVGALSLAVWVGIVWLASMGSLEATERFFLNLLKFGSSQHQQPRSDLLTWAVRLIRGAPHGLTRLSVALPFLLATSTILLRPRYVSGALYAGSVASAVVLWLRFDQTTMVEVTNLTVMTVVVWVVRVGAPAVAAWAARSQMPLHLSLPGGTASLSRWGLPALTIITVTVAGSNLLQAVAVERPLFAEADATEAAVDQFTTEEPGRIAILILGNDHRPMTRDSAIFKGGTNVAESSFWGISPLVRDLVPERHYFFPAAELKPPIDVSPFQYLLFNSLEPPERVKVTTDRLASTFGLSLIGFTCPMHVQMPQAARVQWGCRRTPDASIEEHQGEIGYAPDALTLEAGAPVATRSGSRAPQKVGDAVFSAATGEIWRRDGGGAFTRLLGRPGQQVRIDGLGMWLPERRAMAGVTGQFDGTHWTLDPITPQSVNTNPSLRMRPDRSIRGWDISNRDRLTVERGHEAGAPDDDGWLSIRSRAAGTEISVRTSLDMGRLRGAPIIAAVTARSIGGGSAHLRLRDSGAPAGSDGEDVRAMEPGVKDTLLLHLEPEQIRGRRIELVIEMDDAETGAGLDIWQAELIAGRLP
ncbi:MAG: hypothetical protein AB7K36_17315 [Chloroflexota bacterium]